MIQILHRPICSPSFLEFRYTKPCRASTIDRIRSGRGCLRIAFAGDGSSDEAYFLNARETLLVGLVVGLMGPPMA